MLANTTAFGEADVIAVMRHYFSKTSTFHDNFSVYFSALTPVFSEHTSSLAIVSQPSKCLKFMTFREGCFVIHVEYKYLSEALEIFIITISFTKDEIREHQSDR